MDSRFQTRRPWGPRVRGAGGNTEQPLWTTVNLLPHDPGGSPRSTPGGVRAYIHTNVAGNTTRDSQVPTSGGGDPGRSSPATQEQPRRNGALMHPQRGQALKPHKKDTCCRIPSRKPPEEANS